MIFLLREIMLSYLIDLMEKVLIVDLPSICMKSFEVMSEPKKIYEDMFREILRAKRSVRVETYIYDDDAIGRKMRDILAKKAREGVEVWLLVDGFGRGGKVEGDFFKKIIDAGGKVKFFKEIRYVLRFFSENHERNHRKMVVIDGEIVYFGSINITASCLGWRELVLKIEGPIAQHFAQSYLTSWGLSAIMSRKKIKKIFHRGFQIIHDIPQDLRKITESKYVEMINKSKKEILIETPYFVPPLRLRRALYKAVARGVDVKIMLPCKSDVRLLDVVRNRWLGSLHKSGIKIYYYMPKILHSKLLIVDRRVFLLGSSNVDYRSFVYDHEINLFGRDKKLIFELVKFYQSGLENSRLFDYEEWRGRSSAVKFIELMLRAIEDYL
jgi:cardiolipin synthase A/B